MLRGDLGRNIGMNAMHDAPMYIAETAPSQIRGLLISMKEFFIVIGMLLGYIAGSLFVDLVAGWRYMYATSAPVSLIMGMGIWWLPPSPRWLLLCAIQGKRNMPDAKEFAVCCLCRLRGQAIDSSASEQVDSICYSCLGSSWFTGGLPTWSSRLLALNFGQRRAYDPTCKEILTCI